MNNLFAQSRSHWVRYDRYEIKTGKTGKRYITPEKTAKPDIYNPLKESSEMVLEALNVGMLMMNRSPEDAVEKAILTFVTHYGLLGLMTALPTTPSFMDYEAVWCFCFTDNIFSVKQFFHLINSGFSFFKISDKFISIINLSVLIGPDPRPSRTSAGGTPSSS